MIGSLDAAPERALARAAKTLPGVKDKRPAPGKGIDPSSAWRSFSKGMFLDCRLPEFARTI